MKTTPVFIVNHGNGIDINDIRVLLKPKLDLSKSKISTFCINQLLSCLFVIESTLYKSGKKDFDNKLSQHVLGSHLRLQNFLQHIVAVVFCISVELCKLLICDVITTS